MINPIKNLAKLKEDPNTSKSQISSPIIIDDSTFTNIVKLFKNHTKFNNFQRQLANVTNMDDLKNLIAKHELENNFKLAIIK